MMIRFKKVETRINVLLAIYLLFGTILILTGCGGNETIPPASILTSGRITLSWNNVPGAASYDIYMSASPDVTTLNSYKISDVTSPITITDLEPGTTYYFVVVVFSDSRESRKSKETSYTVAENEGFIEFGDLLAKSELDDITLQTTKIPASPPLEEKKVVKKPRPQALAAAKKKTGLPAATISGQAEAAKIVPAATTKTDQTAAIKTDPVVTTKAEPAVTTKADQTVQSSVQKTRDVTLAWDDVPNATSYNIYWSEKPGVTKLNGNKIANIINPYKMKDLIIGKKYYFVVTAVNQSVESNESGEFSFTVEP